MTGYFIRRLLWIIPVLWAITLITFLLMHAVKGGPFEPGQTKASTAAREALKAKYHLDEPIYVQYGYYMKGLVKGDLGPDLATQGLSVNHILAKNWKPTVTLGILTTLYATVIGIALGILAATKRNSLIDYLSVGFATVGASTPNFVLGIMLVLVFSVKLKYLPAIGWSESWTDWRPVVMPVIALGSLPAAFVARLTRASMLEVMNQDYIRTARAKGLREPWSSPVCTWCPPPANPLASGKSEKQYDHILMAGCGAPKYRRIMDQPITVQHDGRALETRLSDHFGLMAEIPR